MPVVNGQLVKATNQTINNNTITIDNELSFTMLANTPYNVEILVSFNSTGLLPSYRWTVTGPTGPTNLIIQNDLLILGGVSISTTTSNTYGTSNTSPTLTGGAGILKINVIVANGATPGNLSFNFACASGTSVTTLAGSYLRYTYAT